MFDVFLELLKTKQDEIDHAKYWIRLAKDIPDSLDIKDKAIQATKEALGIPHGGLMAAELIKEARKEFELLKAVIESKANERQAEAGGEG